MRPNQWQPTARVWAVLGRIKVGTTYEDLLALGYDRSRIATTLNRLVDRGFIVQVGKQGLRGIYSITDEGRTALEQIQMNDEPEPLVAQALRKRKAIERAWLGNADGSLLQRN